MNKNTHRVDPYTIHFHSFRFNRTRRGLCNHTQRVQLGSLIPPTHASALKFAPTRTHKQRKEHTQFKVRFEPFHCCTELRWITRRKYGDISFSSKSIRRKSKLQKLSPLPLFFFPSSLLLPHELLDPPKPSPRSIAHSSGCNGPIAAPLGGHVNQTLRFKSY